MNQDCPHAGVKKRVYSIPMCPQCLQLYAPGIKQLENIVHQELVKLDGLDKTNASDLQRMQQTVDSSQEIFQALPEAYDHFVNRYWRFIDYNNGATLIENQDFAWDNLRTTVNSVIENMENSKDVEVDMLLDIALEGYLDLLKFLVTIFKQNEHTKVRDGQSDNILCKLDFRIVPAASRQKAIPGREVYNIPWEMKADKPQFETDDNTSGSGDCQFDAIARQIRGRRLKEEYRNFEINGIKYDCANITSVDVKLFVVDFIHRTIDDNDIWSWRREPDGTWEDGWVEIENDKWGSPEDYLKMLGEKDYKNSTFGNHITLTAMMYIFQRSVYVADSNGRDRWIYNKQNMDKEPFVLACISNAHYISLKFKRERVRDKNWGNVYDPPEIPLIYPQWGEEIKNVLKEKQLTVDDLKERTFYPHELIDQVAAEMESERHFFPPEVPRGVERGRVRGRGRGGQISGRGRGFVVEKGGREGRGGRGGRGGR